MIKVYDRRQKDIEKLRNENLEYYYSNIGGSMNNNNLLSLGLNMYVKEHQSLESDLYNVFHKSKYNPQIILHPQQVECINLLFKNNNMLLSAPTSFGKTYVAFEFICRNDFDNIVFVVPTIALMNEIVKKINDKFSQKYNIITNSFEDLEDKNIFVLVPERVDIDLLNKIKSIDFLIFDEIYKLKRDKKDGKVTKTDKRIIALNKGYFDLVKKSKKILLLGPFIKNITFERTKLNLDIVKYFTDYSPVYNKINFVEGKNEFTIKNLKTSKQKLVYFKSPGSIYNFCNNFLTMSSEFTNFENSLTKWCDKYISENWLPSVMLKRNIGIHHGGLPNFMKKYIENIYNKGDLKNILCTSTLLEGINTPTNELIIYDSDKLTDFELNNLIGRVGRLGTNQVGYIYLFDKNLQEKVLGDGKYEEIEIVAEDNIVVEIEEILYLDKEKSLLSEIQRETVGKLEEYLKIYNKELKDLINTDGFVVKELIAFLENIPILINKMEYLHECIYNMTGIDKEKVTIARGGIIEIFMKIIPHNDSSIYDINKNLDKKIKASVCVNKLLAKKPSSIYEKIKKQINEQQDKMNSGQLSEFIDYLFSLSFKYIKYELSRVVKYCNFIFDEKYIRYSSKKEIFETFQSNIIQRFEMFNSENDPILKILLELAIPYTDAKKIVKILKMDVQNNKVSTGKVLKEIALKIEQINGDSSIEDVTKDLLAIQLGDNKDS